MGGIPIIKLFSLQDTAAIGGEMQGWEWHSEGDQWQTVTVWAGNWGEIWQEKRPEKHAEDSPTPHTHTYTCTRGSSKFAQEPLPVAV